MAPNLRESISRAVNQAETNRQSNIEYLLAAHQTFLAHSNLGETVNRYYRTRINNLLDCDKDCVNKLFQLADDSVFCAFCGNLETIKPKDFRQVNRSKARIHCRKLKGISIQHCNKCNPKELHFKTCTKRQFEDKPPARSTKVPNKKSAKSRIAKTRPLTDTPATVKPISQIKKSKSLRSNLSKPLIPDEKGPKLSSRLQAFSWFLKE